VFTGLVDAVGTIVAVAATSAGREFRIRSSYRDLSDGESIAVAGACLTVREHGADADGGWFTVAAVETTLGRTAMGEWHAGRRVNLERAMRLGDRLGGHLVLGHVDGVGRVTEVRQSGDARLVDIALPAGLDALMVPHGSLTVDGVSLTVNELPAPDVVQISLIEFTLRHTALDDLRAGDAVHVEADVLGKHVARLLARGGLAGADLATLVADAR
jgi:riboflavin synthase